MGKLEKIIYFQICLYISFNFNQNPNKIPLGDLKINFKIHQIRQHLVT